MDQRLKIHKMNHQSFRRSKTLGHPKTYSLDDDHMIQNHMIIGAHDRVTV